MSLKLRQSVPLVWVLLRIVTLVVETSSQSEAKLWLAEPSHFLVNLDSSREAYSLAPSANYCTVQALSWFHGRMSHLSVEQKQQIRSLYKSARKVAHLEAHVKFLSKCEECDFIPKSFKAKYNLPGNKHENQRKLDQISKEAINDEKQKHLGDLGWATNEFLKQKTPTNFLTILNQNGHSARI